MSLRGFHLFFITLSMVLASGFGAWGLVNEHAVLGALSLIAAVALLGYGGYFIQKTAALDAH